MSGFRFDTTRTIVFGAGEVQAAGQLAGRLGRRALVVTDRGLQRAGLVDPLLRSLSAAGVAASIFAEVSPDPGEDQVLAALARGRDCAADLVIGLGGGSPMDVAKLAALLLAGGQALADCYGVDRVRGGRLPLMLVPTTAGTGSEATPVAVVTTGSHEKKGVVSPVILPDIALLDPALTLGLPPAATAATGIDAMVHAIEAHTSASANNNPISRGLAEQALRLLGGAIARAVSHGADLQARSDMLLGALLAGQAFANSPVAAVHALAYPLGGSFGLPHGLSNALMLGQVLRFNAQACHAAYAELAVHAFGAPRTADTRAGCERFIDALESLMLRIGIRPGLRNVGIPQSALPELARQAMQQQRLLVNNPRPLDYDDALKIYCLAW